MFELETCFVCNKPCADGNDGFQRIQSVFFQCFSGLNDINDHIGKTEDGSDLNRTVELDNADVAALGLIIPPRDVWKLGCYFQRAGLIVPERFGS